MTGSRLDAVARSACRRLRSPDDPDDLYQDARIAAWLHRDVTPDGLLVVIVRRRVIEQQRRRHGNHMQRAFTLRPLDDAAEPLVEDDYDPAALYGLTGRLAVLARGLAAGDEKQAIAARLGVSPSRVSQLMPLLRSALMG